MRRRISLANKCLLLFGGAVVLTVLATAAAPWLRMNNLVDDGQLELSRRMAQIWDRLDRDSTGGLAGYSETPSERAGISARRISVDQARARAGEDEFVARAIETFEGDAGAEELHGPRWEGLTREYRYAQAVRGKDGLEGIVLLQRRSIPATELLLINGAYLISAGSVVLGVAMLAFYLITHRLILSPVRSLKDTAERVREGNLLIRSDIQTGDEFEELADTFNVMLSDLQAGQEQLRGINAALDLKINELREANVALYDAARVKGEFLANISHELRTPLNSIIGFAELLGEIAKADVGDAEPTPVQAKRLRYVDRILTAGRGLLDLINQLLEMAKIEAGKVEVHAQKVSLRDACEGLIGLIWPQAERKSIQVKLEASDDVPMVSTDVKKFQQIVFNFLSNAVKFTEAAPPGGKTPTIIVRVERLASSDPERVRVSVIDNGPGIPREEHARIFDKFHQLDGGHTRGQGGTGLGLSIARELATILQGEIQLVSDIGRGSMFSLILPVEYDPASSAETALEAKFRGTLSGRKAWV
ncbi:MAG: HAMP domain-containing histidine kinase [Phycisphaerales bacterium]|jgi:two-component system sensor histidine kinase BarA|nr:HAMP domain-containing histidine kinase [Phycisphaerales bacterium]